MYMGLGVMEWKTRKLVRGICVHVPFLALIMIHDTCHRRTATWRAQRKFANLKRHLRVSSHTLGSLV